MVTAEIWSPVFPSGRIHDEESGVTVELVAELELLIESHLSVGCRRWTCLTQLSQLREQRHSEELRTYPSALMCIRSHWCPAAEGRRTGHLEGWVAGTRPMVDSRGMTSNLLKCRRGGRLSFGFFIR
jgi:hypothetical protein